MSPLNDRGVRRLIAGTGAIAFIAGTVCEPIATSAGQWAKIEASG